ncbi:MAG: glycosyltransferase family 4 protein [Elusimicrobiota bacterium]
MKMYRIAVDCRFVAKDSGGIKRYTLCLLDELSKLDSNVFYILIALKGSEKTLREYFPHRRNIKIISVGYGPYSITSQILLPFVLKKEKVNLFHSPDFMVPLLYTPFKVVSTVHDLIPYLYPQYNYKTLKSKFYFLYRRVLILMLKKSDRIIVVSRCSERDLKREFTFCSKKVRMVYNGFFAGNAEKEKSIADLKAKYKIRDKYIFYAGRQDPSKNILGLIKAFYKIKNKLKGYSLVIAGKKDSRYCQPYRLVEDLNLQDDVIFTGYVSEEELDVLYRKAEVFVFPSLYEGFGLPPLEAMARGVAVVVSNRSSLPEIAGDAAVKADPFDIADLAEAIFTTVSNKKKREELIKKGYERIKMFSWEKSAFETMKVYKELINEKNDR